MNCFTYFVCYLKNVLLRQRQEQIDASLAEIDLSVRNHLSELVETWEELGLDDGAVKSRFVACQAHVNVRLVLY